MIVFDLDGTLSIVGDRIKHLQGTTPDWDSFYEACGEDDVNEPVLEVYSALMETGWDIKIVTGRSESVREKTLGWFDDNSILINRPEILIMRKDGDFRHDTIVKPELVSDFINDIQMVFEDRNSMVEKWRELGIVCLQVAEGKF